ncbi:ATP synthase subunit I [Microbaculum sp. FT89]|uniref:ATP synthase subunit I n=1 Tax=Microbaculum sp. FT89 TaxID=3447298 RepID=UPI003F52AB96
MSASTVSLISQLGLGLLVGLVVGAVHFGSLWWNTQIFARSGSMVMALAIQFGRFGLLAAVFIFLSRFGALPLLAGALGLLVARQVVIRRLGPVG